MVLLLFFVDFESDGVVVIEENAEEVVEVNLLVPLGDLVNVVGHGQVLQYHGRGLDTERQQRYITSFNIVQTTSQERRFAVTSETEFMVSKT